MKQKYRYGTTKYIAPGENFSHRFKILGLFTLLLIICLGIFTYDFYKRAHAPQAPISKTTVKKINFEDKHFSTPYFKFADSENWEFIQKQSSSSKFVFQKYLPNSDLVQHQLTVYINSMPPPLELASSRVLPVEVSAENNSFSPTKVSDHCGKSYEPGELHKVQLRQIDGSTLLCDPDQGQFRVIITKAGGDYNMKLKRADGTTVNYIIIYQNQKIEADSDTLTRIANSFQST